MRWSAKSIILSAAALTLLALCTWWWFTNMQLAWQREERPAPGSSEQPYLGATLLLRENGFGVDTVSSIDLVDVGKQRDGTMLLGGAQGVITQAKSDQLLAWVARGNTLIFQPREATKDELHELHGDHDAHDSHDRHDHSDAAEAADTASHDPDDDSASTQTAAHSSTPAASEPSETESEHAAHSDTDGEAASAAIETDALASAFGVRSGTEYQSIVCSNLTRRLPRGAKGDADYRGQCPPGTVKASALRSVNVPGMGAVTFDARSDRLLTLSDARTPLWGNQAGDALRGYQHGKGQVIMAPGHMFRNEALRHHDHGALLLGLARLNGAHKHVTIVKSRTIVPWYSLLWMHYHMLIVALAALLALLFWASVRRFGPLLPDPAPERRSLMEHIDASGAWLWKANGGRQVLIDAARADLRATLQQRAPALLRLSETQQQDELARLCGFTATEVAQAMYYEPAAINADFTRQIRTLQTMRLHHER